MNELIEQLETLSRAVPAAPGFVKSVHCGLVALPPRAPSRTWRILSPRRVFAASGAIAACALIAVTIWLSVAGSATAAFGKSIAAIRNARTLTATVVRDGVRESVVLAKQGVGTRVETAMGMIFISNKQNRTFLRLDPGSHTAGFTPLGANPPEPEIDPTEWLRNLPTANAERVGELTINGRHLTGLRTKSRVPGMSSDAEVTVWVDAETNVPDRIELKPVNAPPGSRVQQSWVLTDIRLDVPLEDSLFDTTPPAGYRVITIPAGPTSRPI